MSNAVLNAVHFFSWFRLLRPDICFAARRPCQFSVRRLLLALVGGSVGRLSD